MYTPLMLTHKLLIDDEVRHPLRRFHQPVAQDQDRFPWLRSLLTGETVVSVFVSDLGPRFLDTEIYDFTCDLRVISQKVWLLGADGRPIAYEREDFAGLLRGIPSLLLGRGWPMSKETTLSVLQPGEVLRRLLVKMGEKGREVRYAVSYSPDTNAAIVYIVPPGRTLYEAVNTLIEEEIESMSHTSA